MTRRCIMVLTLSAVAPIILAALMAIILPPQYHAAIAVTSIVFSIGCALAATRAARKEIRAAEIRGADDALTEAITIARASARQRPAQSPQSHQAAD